MSLEKHSLKPVLSNSQIKVKILRFFLLNDKLGLKSECKNAEDIIIATSEFLMILDASWWIIYYKLDRITESGATLILPKLPTEDFTTLYFIRKGLLFAY